LSLALTLSVQVVLKQRPHNPVVVGEVIVDPTTADTFTNALHGSYSGLKKTLELPFAQELDNAFVGSPREAA
jgi:hypothetical protein